MVNSNPIPIKSQQLPKFANSRQKMKKYALILFCFFSTNGLLLAQKSNTSNRNLENNPVWIEMMDDSLTNFFEAQKAFEIFWKIRPLPIEEEDLIGHTELGEAERKSWLQTIFHLKRQRQKEEVEKYAFQYKRFKNWERANLPYVQEDGRILTPTERIAIWRQKQSR